MGRSELVWAIWPNKPFLLFFFFFENFLYQFKFLHLNSNLICRLPLEYTAQLKYQF
jgi:hypothetical protein